MGWIARLFGIRVAHEIHYQGPEILTFADSTGGHWLSIGGKFHPVKSHWTRTDGWNIWTL